MWHGGGSECGYSVVVGSEILICVGVGFGPGGGSGMVGLWVGVGQWVAAAWWEWILKLIFSSLQLRTLKQFLAQGLISGGGFYGGGVEFGFGF
nr:hypothetical protein CFP56_13568 [Quercus suber]